MKKIVNRFAYVLMFSLLLSSCQSQKTEVILMGTVHQAIENFNADSLYSILEKVNPDLILFEVDSSFFTDDFHFKKPWKSNENIATIRYQENYKIDIRPYDFSGRNQQRVKIGARPTDSKAIQMLDSLFKEKQLNSSDSLGYIRYKTLTTELNSFAFLGAKSFNNTKVDSLARLRQNQQYRALHKIMKNYPIFAHSFIVKADGDSISYLDGFKRAGDFWYLRTETMAKNIQHFAENFHYKRIIVLNGYYHRFHIYSELLKNNSGKYIIKDFYEF